MFENMQLNFFVDNRPSKLKAKPKELDLSLENFLANRNDSASIEEFKEGKRFFKGVAATTSQINLFGDKISGRFSKKGLQSLLSDFDFQGIAVRTDHDTNSLAIGKVFDLKVVTKDGQTRLEALFWIDGNEPVISKMDSGTYSELSVSFGGFRKLSCGQCSSPINMDAMVEKVFWEEQDYFCENDHKINDPKNNFLNMDDCKPLDEISVVYSGRVRDTSIVKLSKDHDSLQSMKEELQSKNKFLISGAYTNMTVENEKPTSASQNQGSFVDSGELLKIIQEHATFKAQISFSEKETTALKAENEDLKAKLAEVSEKNKEITEQLSQEKEKAVEFSKAKDSLDNLIERVGLKNETNWADKIVSKYVKAEEVVSETKPDVNNIFDQFSLNALSKMNVQFKK